MMDMNGVMSSGRQPARGGPDGGTEAASSARYLRTVRQSQPHSRPISANVAPAACKARKRRMFIQDSASKIMRRSPSSKREGTQLAKRHIRSYGERDMR